MSKIMMSLRTKKKPKWWKSLYCSVHIECLFNWNCTKNVLCLICVRSFSWQGQRENFIYRYCASNRVDLSSFKIGSEKGGGGGGVIEGQNFCCMKDLRTPCWQAGIRHIVDHCLFWGGLVYFVELINLQSITELST